MSSDTDDAAATVALFDILYTGSYCAMAAAVLFLYDTVLTFDGEVAYFWTAKRISGASLLFFANKWISMMVYVTGLVEFASFPSDKVHSLSPSHGQSDQNQSCSLFAIAGHAMALLQLIPGAAFSALRAYVLSRSKLLGIVITALSIAPVGANLVHYGYQYSGENFPPFGCTVTENMTAALQLRFGSFSLITSIGTDSVQGVDIILIYITWTTLRGSTTLTDIQKSKRLTLSDVLFRGVSEQLIQLNVGISILFIMNVLHLTFSATAVASENSDHSFSLITEFTAPNTWDSTPSFISSLGGFNNPSCSVQSDDEGGIELQDHSSSEAPGEEEGEVPSEVVPEATVSSSSTV
ncbi:hypothetical protein OH76DRAFT_1418609 [Lentinus brumalis]|uniref:DUF6533 domain-containing protein n=1 Tax=Lentinus brumalis TaxID=2498619 RepID=A0A371D9A0_9APHY|nr:hypothetical protein OH76DRAFT_1418609 [Polyporus brumalis]